MKFNCNYCNKQLTLDDRFTMVITYCETCNCSYCHAISDGEYYNRYTCLSYMDDRNEFSVVYNERLNTTDIFISSILWKKFPYILDITPQNIKSRMKTILTFM